MPVTRTQRPQLVFTLSDPKAGKGQGHLTGKKVKL